MVYVGEFEDGNVVMIFVLVDDLEVGGDDSAAHVNPVVGEGVLDFEMLFELVVGLVDQFPIYHRVGVDFLEAEAGEEGFEVVFELMVDVGVDDRNGGRKKNP